MTIPKKIKCTGSARQRQAPKLSGARRTESNSGDAHGLSQPPAAGNDSRVTSPSAVAPRPPWHCCRSCCNAQRPPPDGRSPCPWPLRPLERARPPPLPGRESSSSACRAELCACPGARRSRDSAPIGGRAAAASRAGPAWWGSRGVRAAKQCWRSSADGLSVARCGSAWWWLQRSMMISNSGTRRDAGMSA